MKILGKFSQFLHKNVGGTHWKCLPTACFCGEVRKNMIRIAPLI